MSPARQYDEQGYVIGRGMFSVPEMQRFIDEVKGAEHTRTGSESLDVGTMRFYSNLFYTNPEIQKFITQPALIDFIAPIIGPDLWVRWDQAVAKGPNSGVFPWHQDNGYNRLPTEHFQIWIALSEMTPENGGLWVVPGSHKKQLKHRPVGRHMEAVGSEAYDAPGADKVFVRAECGDVVLFSSRTLHKTYENTTDRARWAYVAEFMRTSDYDPTVRRPYFNAARDGKPYPTFTPTLPGRANPLQHLRTLPVATRHYAGAVMRRARRVLENRAPG
jgi:ectoine hydroxylase-related dioxygenase (phytanoyl-CoA dioxygenase family)